MFGLIPWIAGLLLKGGISKSQGRATPLAWLIFAIAAVLLALLAWSLVKGSIIKDHETEQRAQRAEQTLEQTNAANAVDEDLEERDEAATAALEEEATHAAQADPTGAAKPVGPVSRSVHDGLRARRRPAT